LTPRCSQRDAIGPFTRRFDRAAPFPRDPAIRAVAATLRTEPVGQPANEHRAITDAGVTPAYVASRWRRRAREGGVGAAVLVTRPLLPQSHAGSGGGRRTIEGTETMSQWPNTQKSSEDQPSAPTAESTVLRERYLMLREAFAQNREQTVELSHQTGQAVAQARHAGRERVRGRVRRPLDLRDKWTASRERSERPLDQGHLRCAAR
jgi:hypothetical protein